MNHMTQGQFGDISILSRFPGSVPVGIYLIIALGKVIEYSL